ncbi:cation diffusion facilitator family transporter [Ructibacterium gallinarum]|uniref:Cation transporter n=1 Tax=Ructibacterium gallinarum TaxID=2779355 RepID=A0A9D5R8Z1_9FIRM|nr:cation diffusion facilitator family transporter [Ructibacterium gallinarum]MBE5039924.1 cation transporter [Ructibacterium gallinarum]
MIQLLVHKFIPNYMQTKDAQVRKQYGVLGGVLGILCNSLLFLLKLLAGLAAGSIAVVSDAFNNLSDLGSSVVSVVGAKLSSRRPDSGHPYGHGRAEYVSALIVAFLIILFGLELLKSSAEKIFRPEALSISPMTVGILVLSVLVKLWMWSYNRFMGKTIDSPILLAAARDSLNDVIATSAVIVSTFLSPFVPFSLDGFMGLVVSCLVIWTGYGVARDTIDKLLGRKPEETLRRQLEKRILSNPIVLGMHGLMVHDYGPGRTIASVHAEVPENLTLVEVHSVIDKIEHQILNELNVDIVIHMDPVPVPDAAAKAEHVLDAGQNPGDTKPDML